MKDDLILRNGYVVDPANGIDGDRMDIFVHDGRIVERTTQSNPVEIDVSGMLVMAGGVDIHNPR